MNVSKQSRTIRNRTYRLYALLKSVQRRQPFARHFLSQLVDHERFRAEGLDESQRFKTLKRLVELTDCRDAPLPELQPVVESAISIAVANLEDPTEQEAAHTDLLKHFSKVARGVFFYSPGYGKP